MRDKHFIDWESETFGYGYGTGEEYTLKTLKSFLELCNGENDMYDYKILEKALTPTVTWLMINILCHADIIEYGASPRYAWLNEKGRTLKKYISDKTVDKLYELTNVNEDYIYCYRHYCNCEINCKNPLFH